MSFKMYTLVIWAAVLLLFVSNVLTAPPTEWTSITIRHIPAPKLVSRAACSSTSPCGRSQFCNAAKTCQTRLIDGSTCTVASQGNCLSGICDKSSLKCATNRLSLGSTCANSDACLSGNCMATTCQNKLPLNAPCTKDTNCQSGSCNLKQGSKCVTPPQPLIHPVVPWNADLANLGNLDPTLSSVLFFTDSGRFDISVVQLFAALHMSPFFPTVILSHSSWVGQVTCKNKMIEVPFTSDAAYQRVSKSWSRTGPFMIVTHTEGCAPSTKQDERTFWLVKGLTFDDAHRTVDANALQVALEDVVGHMQINFGAGQTPSTGTGNTPSTGTGNTPSTGTGQNPSTGTGNTGTSPSPGTPSSGSGGTSPSPGVPTPPVTGSCLATPALCNVADFDRSLDNALGYYDFENDFSNSLKQFAPGLPSFDRSYYENLIADPNARRDLNLLVKRGWFSKIVKAVVKIQAKIVVAVVKAVVKNVILPVLKTAIRIVGATPIGKLIDAVVSRWTPSISGKIPMYWKPIQGFDSPWGMQARFFQTSKAKETTKGAKGKDAAKSKALNTKKSPAATLKAEGEIAIFCVDCLIDGYFAYKGTLGFSLAEAKITKCTVDYSGKLDVTLQFGFEAHAKLDAEYREELLRFPLPGGFAIKNIISVGPAFVLEQRVDLRLDAEVDLLIGGTFTVPPFSTHLDLLDKAKSTSVNGGKPSFTPNISIAGSLVARASYGLPMLLVLGLDIPPLKTGKEVALSMEAGYMAIAMTASDVDKFSDQGLEPCDTGLAWKLGTGVAFALNLWDWSKYSLGKFNGPNLADGCIPMFDPATLPAPTPNPTTSVPTPPSCPDKKGARWGYYSNNFPEPDADKTYSLFKPESFKTAIPLDQGITQSIGYNQYIAQGQQTTFYGSQVKVSAGNYAVNHVGYFVPPYAGTYEFTLTYGDNIVLLWMGGNAAKNDVVKNYNRSNKDMELVFPGAAVKMSFTFDTANTYIPFRVMHADAGAPSQFTLDVTGPQNFATRDFANAMYTQSCDGTTAPPFVDFGKEA